MKQILFLLISTFSLSGQIKGVVKDSISGEPISYVNIWVENENTGTTSEEDGSFSISNIEKNSNLIFSVLGYETKKVKNADKMVIMLKPMLYELNEVTVLNKKHTKFLEIGNVDNSLMQAYDNGPKVEAKYFPYNAKYKKTKFIKKVTIFTDSRIDSATIKIHFFSVDSLGRPGTELLNKDFIVTLKKGVIKHKFDVADFNLLMPTNGLFVAYEKLLIAKNRTSKGYQPYVLYNNIDRDFVFVFSGGKWTKFINKESPLEKLTINEPAINLILSN
jgi:hypothetical protein